VSKLDVMLASLAIASIFNSVGVFIALGRSA
jgi:hypothetical protein